MLTTYFERAREVVDRFGGVIDKYIGDALMAVWGAHTAHEDDGERIPVPEFMESTFIQVLRAYAKGYEDDADNQATMSQRLMDVATGPVFQAAVDVDGRIQPDYGPLRGGAVQSMPQGYNRFLRTTVAGPS